MLSSLTTAVGDSPWLCWNSSGPLVKAVSSLMTSWWAGFTQSGRDCWLRKVWMLKLRRELAHATFYLFSEFLVPVHHQICFCLKIFPQEHLPNSDDTFLSWSWFLWNQRWDYISSIGLSEKTLGDPISKYVSLHREERKT